MKKKYLKLSLIVVLVISLFTIPVLADGVEFTDKINDLMNIIKAYYYKDISTEELIDGAFKGMFEVLDKHSTYFTAEEYADFISDVSGDIVGVGIQIEKKEHITVVSPIEGTPAYKAGVQTKDEIIYVDDLDISDYTVEQAVKLIRGVAGTKVRLGIRRAGVEDILYFDLIREVITINPVEYEIKSDNIGYIKITQFNGHVYQNVSKAVNEMKQKNVKGVVIDVRNNPGGYLDEVINICKLLIRKGPIVHIDYKSNPRETYSSSLAQAPFKVVVLINGGSASASEILAGAIKDSNTGKLIGEKTYGKGTVQSIFSYPDGSGLKITIANYLTPSGFSLDGIGLEPDVKVQNPSAEDIEKEYSPIKADRNLKYITIGLDVQGVQQRLIAMGYKIPKADGIYTLNTKAAVIQFEKDNSLKADGVLETKEQETLKEIFRNSFEEKDVQLDTAIQELKKLLNE